MGAAREPATESTSRAKPGSKAGVLGGLAAAAGGLAAERGARDWGGEGARRRHLVSARSQNRIRQDRTCRPLLLDIRDSCPRTAFREPTKSIVRHTNVHETLAGHAARKRVIDGASAPEHRSHPLSARSQTSRRQDYTGRPGALLLSTHRSLWHTACTPPEHMPRLVRHTNAHEKLAGGHASADAHALCKTHRSAATWCWSVASKAAARITLSGPCS